MICPKCKTEYQEGFTECLDCAVDLVEQVKQDKPVMRISKDGQKLFKFGIFLLSAVFTKLIVVVMFYEFHYVYSMSHGGIGGTVIKNVHPLIWWLVVIEIIISLSIIIGGLNQKEKL